MRSTDIFSAYSGESGVVSPGQFQPSPFQQFQNSPQFNSPSHVDRTESFLLRPPPTPPIKHTSSLLITPQAQCSKLLNDAYLYASHGRWSVSLELGLRALKFIDANKPHSAPLTAPSETSSPYIPHPPSSKRGKRGRKLRLKNKSNPMTSQPSISSSATHKTSTLLALPNTSLISSS
ncbi:hypothetical protein ADUPG1_014039, partial [Aduncisulcus paluster]